MTELQQIRLFLLHMITVCDIAYNDEKDRFELNYKDLLFDYTIIVGHRSFYYQVVKSEYEKRKAK